MFTLTGVGCLADSGGDDVDTGTDIAAINGGVPVPVGELEAVGTIPGCTATLITDSLVLTAAHCVCNSGSFGNHVCQASTGFTLKNVRPVSNPSIRMDMPPIPGTVIVHPDYEMGGWLANDLAVIRLSQPASSVALVSPIPFTGAYPAVGTELTLVGLGGMEGPNGDCSAASNGKRKVTVALDEYYYGPSGDVSLQFYDETKHSCGGDSGGPALTPEGRVVGVSSAGNNQNDAGYRAVPAYQEWVGLQGNSPGGRVGVFDVAGSAPATSDYLDDKPEPAGLLGWIDSNDSQIVGDFMNLGRDQVLYINRGGSGGKLRIAGYGNASGPTQSFYWENWGQSGFFAGWLDSNDAQLAGDFMGRGYDQLLCINRSGIAGRMMVVDFALGFPQVSYYATYTSDPWLNGWHDTSDGLLVGDFRHVGHDQLMMINRAGFDGRVLIVSFRDGVAPADWYYYEHYNDGVYLNGWHDTGDLLLAGDFRGLGHDQVMFVNRGAGNGRVLITDFSDGWFPAEWQFYMDYWQAGILNPYLDSATDVAMAGDYRVGATDEVVFINRATSALDRILVAGFTGPNVIQQLFVQTQVNPSGVLPRVQSNDLVRGGDPRGRGYDQLITLERLEQ